MLALASFDWDKPLLLVNLRQMALLFLSREGLSTASALMCPTTKRLIRFPMLLGLGLSAILNTLSITAYGESTCDIPVAKTTVDNNTYVLTCMTPGVGLHYLEIRNGISISEIQMFASNRFDFVVDHMNRGCKGCSRRDTTENWLNQYGKQISTKVVIFSAASDPNVIEIHQMFRKFGQAASITNAKSILETGVVP